MPLILLGKKRGKQKRDYRGLDQNFWQNVKIKSKQ